jgi:hypothetical protein
MAKYTGIFTGIEVDTYLQKALDADTPVEVDNKVSGSLSTANSYTDAQDALVLASAQLTTENLIAINNLAVGQNSSNNNAQTLQDANNFAVNQDAIILASAQGYADDGDTLTLVSAKAYADDITGSEITQTYVDNGDIASIAHTDSLETRIGNQSGHGFYVDTGTVQPFLDGIPQKFTVDGVDMIDEDLPNGASSYWDVVTNDITLDQQGGMYGFGFRAIVDADTRDKHVVITWVVKDGIGPGVPYVMGERFVRLAKDLGVLTPISMYFALPAGVLMMSNVIELYLTFEGTDADVSVKTIEVLKLNAPLLP